MSCFSTVTVHVHKSCATQIKASSVTINIFSNVPEVSGLNFDDNYLVAFSSHHALLTSFIQMNEELYLTMIESSWVIYILFAVALL